MSINPKKTIEILGGGLSGLVAGILLARRAVPVRLHEAGAYPRHRVCGEFMCGLTPAWLKEHGLIEAFEDACLNQSCGWFGKSDRPFYEVQLPEPVWGISRHLLDHRLSEIFIEAGGELSTQSRIDPIPAPGRILACGRAISGTPRWVGLKAHFANLESAHDLEIHLGKGGYLGVARIENGRHNVCGLFPASAVRQAGAGEDRLAGAVDSIGLKFLAARLRSTDMVAGSLTGCARFSLGWQKPPALAPEHLAIGDALAIIPPFTGNGMTMAMHAAALLVPEIEEYACREQTWTEVVARIRAQAGTLFTRRMRWAARAHPVLLHPAGQSLLQAMARTGLLPFQSLFRLTH